MNFESVDAAASGTASFADIPTLPGSPSRQLLLAVFGFEGQAPGSGPWLVEGNPAHTPIEMCASNGWYRVLYEPPDVTGCGLEVWAGIWTSGTTSRAVFAASYSFVLQTLIYAGVYDPGGSNPDPVTDGTIRGSTSAQVDGNNPACPAVFAFAGELIVAVGADKLASPGWGDPPAGWLQRLDSARGSTHGNVEIQASDQVSAVGGDTGTIPFTATAAGGGHGATATLAIRPTPATSASPLIDVEYAAPS